MNRFRLVALALALASVLTLASAGTSSAATSAPNAEVAVRLDKQGTRIGTLPAGGMARNLDILQVSDGSAIATWQEAAPNGPVIVPVAELAAVRLPGSGGWTQPLRIPQPAGMRDPVRPLTGRHVASLPGGRFAIVTGWMPESGLIDGRVEVRIWDGASWSQPVIAVESVYSLGGLAVDGTGRVHLLVDRLGFPYPTAAITSWKDGATTTTPLENGSRDGTFLALLAAGPNDAMVVWGSRADLRMSRFADGTWSAPTPIESPTLTSPFGRVRELRWGGSGWYLSWIDPAPMGGNPTTTFGGRLYYRFGPDLASAPTTTYGSHLSNATLMDLVGGEIAFGGRGPIHVWSSSGSPCGTFVQNFVDPVESALRVTAGYTSFPKIEALADGRTRVLVRGAGMCSGVPSVNDWDGRMLVLDQAGAIVKRYRLVAGNDAKDTVASGTAGPHVRLVWTLGSEVRTGVLQDHGAAPNRVVGGSENDTLAGGGGGDSIAGNAGTDVIYGEAGNDALGGGAGNDRIDGGAGNDRIIGGTGTDTINGGPGNDRINTIDGRADVVRCGPGRDRVMADWRDRVVGCEEIMRARRFKI